jgi:uncharacterized membrane protein
LSASRAAAAGLAAEEDYAPTAAQRLLHLVLFVTVLTSSLAFIEPSPHDGLMAVLLVMCVAARVPFDRKLIPLLALLMIWLVGGCFSLIQVGDQQQAIQYVGTSFYLCLAAVMFACLFSDGDPARLSILRRGYLLAALIATAAGYIGFFHLAPGSDRFLFNERVSATFKDPNVYGPFLIFPLLMLMTALMTRGIRILNLTLVTFLVGGLFLSFSRGAWIHFVLSAVVAVALLIATTPDSRVRGRILLFAAVAAFGGADGGRDDVGRRGARPVSRARQGDPALRHRAWRPVLGTAARPRRHSRFTRTAWAHSSSAASSACSSTTSTCRGFWSMGGWAAPPI